MSGSTGTEAYVQIPPNSTGAVIDGFTVDPPGTLAPAFRQAVVIADSADADNVAAVDCQNRLTVHVADLGLLDLISEDIAQADGSGPGLLKPGGIAADGTEPSLVVQISPLTPLIIDQSQATAIGGVGPDGAVRRARVGTDGGLQLSDAVGQPIALGAAGASLLLDTSGYQSIALQLSGTWAGTASFACSNDAQTWQAVSGVASTAPSTLVATATANGQFVFPTMARYFRLSLAYTSGLLLALPYLRSTPMPIAAAVNVASIGGTAVSAAAGVQALNLSQVAGVVVPILSGSVSAAVPAGGMDMSTALRALRTDTAGLLNVGGVLQAGGQFGIYNTIYTPYTTANVLKTYSIAQSVPTPLTVGGLDQSNAARFALTSSAGAFQVGSEPSSPANQSIQELLLQLVALGRVQAQYLYDIRAAMTATSPPDEPDVLLGDFLNPATALSNMFN